MEDDQETIASISSSNINKSAKRKIIQAIKANKELTEHQKSEVVKSNLSKEVKRFIVKREMGNNKSGNPEDDDPNGDVDPQSGDEEDQSVESEYGEEEGDTEHDTNFRMLATPESFDGEPSKARAWLDDYIYCAKVNRWNLTNKLIAKRLPAFLKGSARNWYRVCIMNTDIEFDFKEIKKQFELVFLPQSNRRSIAQEIETKKQKPNEPVSNFIMDMRLLCRQYDKDMGEDEIIDKIRFRLLKSFFPHISQVRTNKLSEFTQECLFIEEGNRERSEPTVSAVVPTRKACYHCGRRNHIARDCNDQRYRSNYNQNDQANKTHYRNNYNQQFHHNHNNNRRSNFNNNTYCPPSQRNTYANYNSNRQRRNYQPKDNYNQHNHQNPNQRNDYDNPNSQQKQGNNAQKIQQNNQQSEHLGEKQSGPPVRRGRGGYRNLNNANNYTPPTPNVCGYAYAVTQAPICAQTKIANKVTTQALVDTGASVSIINGDIARQVGIKVSPPTNALMKAANGSPLGFNGKIETCIELLINGESVKCDAELNICENLPVTMLIGIDLLTKLGITIDCANQNLIPPKFQHNNDSHHGVCFIVAKTVLPPRTSTMVEVIAPMSKNNTIYMDNTSLDGVIVPNCVASTKDNRANIIVTNLSNAPIEIERGKELTKWQVADIRDTSKESCVNLVVKDSAMGELHVGDHLSKHQTNELINLLRSYKSIFSDGSKLGTCSFVKHKIELIEPKPFNQPLRRLAYKEKEVINQQVQQMLHDGVIIPSKSPFNSPIVLVKKPDGSIRFCIDFRMLNSHTKKWAFPLPNQDDILSSGGGAKYITRLDMNSGFWQIAMEPESQEYTAFSTIEGQYQFIKMPFGLSNAAASFQKMINVCLSGALGHQIHAYLDDIIIMSGTWADHIKNIQLVLSRLAEAGLTIKLKKCTFAQEKANILGHTVDATGTRPQKDKLDAIRKLRAPTNVDEVRRVLGLVGYYRKFVTNFAQLAGPLTDLTRKDVKWSWTNIHERSFKDLIDALLNSKAIAHFRQGLPVRIKTDASLKGLSGILLQKQDEEWRVVATTSRRLARAEENYSITELEGAAMIHSLNKFRPYIFGRPVEVIVDHCALCALSRTKPLTGRLARWALAISEYQLDIKYQSGELHADADCLSRLPIEGGNDNINVDRMALAIIPLDDWRSDYEDVETMDVIRSIQHGEDKYHMANGYIYKGQSLYVPPKWRQDILSQKHDTDTAGHAGIDQTINKVRESYYWDTLAADTKKFVQTCSTCQAYKMPREKEKGTMCSFDVYYPMELIAMDFYGPLSKSKRDNKHILLAIDCFSKFIIAEATTTTSAEVVYNFIMNKILGPFGAPNRIITDNAPGFAAKKIKDLGAALTTEIIHSTAYHHEGNPMAERAIQTMKDKLAMALVDKDQDDWDEAVPLVTISINTTVSKTTKFTPYEVFFGRKGRLPYDPIAIRDPVDVYVDGLTNRIAAIKASARENTLVANSASKTIYDSHHKDKGFHLNQIVKVYFPPKASDGTTKFSARFKFPYRIISCLPNNIYKLKLADETYKGHKQTITAHVSRIYTYNLDQNHTATDEAQKTQSDTEPHTERIVLAPENSNSIRPTRSKRKQTLEPLTVFLALLISCGTSRAINMCPFPSADQFVLTESDTPVVSGVEAYEVYFTVAEPCDTLFTNITMDTEFNKRLIEQCKEDFYRRVTIAMNAFCGDNSKNRKARFVAEAAAITISSASLVVALDVKLNDIPYLKSSLDQLRRVEEINAKRFDTLNANVENLRNLVIKDRETTQMYLTNLSSRIAEVQKEAQMNTHASILIALFHDKMDKLNTNLALGGVEWRYGRKVSYHVFDMIGITPVYSAAMYKYAQPTSCTNYKGNTLKITFKTHKLDPTTTVLTVNPFNHYKGSLEKLCLQEWKGPTMIMYNASADCYKALTKEMIHADGTVRTLCEETLPLSFYQNIWKESWCINTTSAVAPSQVRTINANGLTYIYCFPETISIKSIGQCRCPPHPFRIPEEEDFEATGIRHTYALSRMNASSNFVTLATEKIQYKLTLSTKPIIIDGYERTSDFMSRHHTINKTEPFEWIKDVAKYPLLRISSNKVVSGILWAWDHMDLVVYVITIIIILFIFSFILPFINFGIWILNRAISPIKSWMSYKKETLLPTRATIIKYAKDGSKLMDKRKARTKTVYSKIY